MLFAWCFRRGDRPLAKTIVVHDEHYLCVLIFPWVLQLLQKIHHEFRKNVPGNFLCAVDCQEALVILELCLMMINAPEDTLIILLRKDWYERAVIYALCKNKRITWYLCQHFVENFRLYVQVVAWIWLFLTLGF